MNKILKLVRLTAKNPKLAFQKAKITFRNSVTAKWDYNFRNGYASPPSTIAIKLTNACNLRCKMCGQPREGSPEGSPKWAPKAFFREKVDLDIFKDLIEQVSAYRPNIYLWGGEPFMYKEIIELIRFIKKNKMTVQINTNGLYIKKLAAQLVEAGLDDLILSIDGPPEVHDQVRGLPGTFALIEKGIKALHEEKEKRGAKKPILRVRGTISPYNFEYIYSLIDIAKQFGADSLNFNWTWFTTKQTGEAHQRLMKRLFDIDAISWKPFEENVIMDEEKRKRFEGIRQELIRFEENKAPFLITMSPYIKPDQVEQYYTNIHETFGNDRCYSVWVKSYILPNGDVTPCPDFPDYITGNITQEKFMDIWNGERYRKWRLELKKRKLFPICYRCCDLFMSDIGIL